MEDDLEVATEELVELADRLRYGRLVVVEAMVRRS
jgi:hypothetical protein